ncbi:hypothetical protein [Mucilaginibacter rubeus]|uniref:hypothetical protein n=1 Tax=Mucilaginibacter rubeus TaxID=2027860 RepID=UPI0016654D5C|nr:hypothetical protein [Mucilaginibacter rubeus]GGB30701.1 hypothetical protein GCM10011500_53860 [Mucilaginibacter rubeus]
MCIIIDTNTLGPVFNCENVNHSTFKPVYNWIIEGQGKVVYGGTKYLEEISKYRRIFKVLKDINKAISIDNEKVDLMTIEASKAIAHPDFDDQHLIGLLLVSKCKLICSDDKRAYPFFTHSLFFKARNRPKIYHTLKGISLLDPKYISEICLPCRASTNYQKKTIKEILPQSLI